MMQVTFDYLIGSKMIRIIANCKSINEESINGLSLTFLDKDDCPVKIEYDADLFEEIEDEATIMLADAYYNPELNFSQQH